VFDAMGGMSRTTVRTTNAGAIDVVYCAAEEADSWIVQEVRHTGLKRWHHAPVQQLHGIPVTHGTRCQYSVLWACCAEPDAGKR